MIGRIARKELLEMLRDGRFRGGAAIVFTLLLSAVALGWQHYREVNAQHQTAQRATRRQWLNQGEKNPHAAAHYGVYAFKPKMPLSLVDQGVDPFVGVATWLEAHHQDEFQYRPAQDATILDRAGELTGATVLQLLVPLLIVLLTFSAFSGEREQGTLRQLLSLGVSRADLALGKAAGITAALGLLLIPATIVGVVAIALSSENGSFGASAPRMALLTLSYLLYFAALLGVSLAVSARASSSRVALVALLGFWIFNGLVAPRAAADLAKALYPTPSSFEFQHAIELAVQNGIDGNEPLEKRTAALRQRLLRQYRVSRLDELPVNFRGIALQDGENYGNRIFDKFFSELWDTFHQQEQVHQWAAIAAPLLAVRGLSMGFAGTDFSHHAHFAHAAEEYRRFIQTQMNFDLTHNGKGPEVYVRGRELWEKVPEFHYHAPGVAWVLSRQTFSLALLAAWAAVAAYAAWRTARSLKVD